MGHIAINSKHFGRLRIARVHTLGRRTHVDSKQKSPLSGNCCFGPRTSNPLWIRRARRQRGRNGALDDVNFQINPINYCSSQAQCEVITIVHRSRRENLFRMCCIFRVAARAAAALVCFVRIFMLCGCANAVCRDIVQCNATCMAEN